MHRYLYTPLLYLDKNLKPISGLAQSWSVLDQGRRYRFVLHERATFSDGTPVRATDVVDTLRKIIDTPALHLVGSFTYLDMSQTRALDTRTIDVVFSKALADQLTTFADVLIVPAERQAPCDARTGAVGSGPYMLVRYDRGQRIVLQRRPGYWKTRPHIEQVIFEVIGDYATAWQALGRGEIDETILTSDTWQHAQENDALARRFAFHLYYTPGYSYIGWNTRHPLLRTAEVRRALGMSIPVHLIVDQLYGGTARRVTGPFDPHHPASNPNVQPLAHSPDMAARILAAAGWLRDSQGVLRKKGQPFALSLLIAGDESKPFAQIVQAALKRVGVQLEVETGDPAMVIERMRAKNYDAVYWAWELDADPDPFGKFHSSQIPPQGNNIVQYVNPDADRLMSQARVEFDHARRMAHYRELHAVLAADQPYTWTVQVGWKWVINRRIGGVELSPRIGPYLWYPGEFAWSVHPAQGP